MLVLCRKNNESILIGDNITVTILDIRKGKVKVGIEAPIDVPVVRSEIDRIDIPEMRKPPRKFRKSP